MAMSKVVDGSSRHLVYGKCENDNGPIHPESVRWLGLGLMIRKVFTLTCKWEIDLIAILRLPEFLFLFSCFVMIVRRAVMPSNHSPEEGE